MPATLDRRLQMPYLELAQQRDSTSRLWAKIV